MKYLLSLFFTFFSIYTFSQGSVTLQDKPFIYSEPLDTSISNALEGNPFYKTLGQKDQKMFYWVNFFRKSPQRFYGTIIKEFLRQFPEANKPEVKSLEKDIDKIKGSLPLFIPETGLIKLTQTHSKDLSNRGGVISHKSSSGKDFVQRIKEAGAYRCGAENIFVGSDNPLEALILLLIDYGVADKGHRLNLLDPSFNLLGLSSSETRNGKTVLVQAFGCK
jgi:Cysteine-rich secretory protein family